MYNVNYYCKPYFYNPAYCVYPNVSFSPTDHVIINIISRNEGFIILYLLIVYVSVLCNLHYFLILYTFYIKDFSFYKKIYIILFLI